MNIIGIIIHFSSIAGGILLAMSTLDKWDGDKDYFKKLGGYLTPYNTIIGGALLAIGIIYFGSRGILYSLLSIAAGLLLLIDVIGKVPAIGALLTKASKALAPFQIGIGLASLAIGVWGLISSF